jgi:hypothetical protein
VHVIRDSNLRNFYGSGPTLAPDGSVQACGTGEVQANGLLAPEGRALETRDQNRMEPFAMLPAEWRTKIATMLE